MPRQRIYENNAARTKAYRLRHSIKRSEIDKLLRWKLTHATQDREATNRRNSKHQKRKVETKMFVAIDGEGMTDKKGKHHYTMLSSSEKHTIEDWKQGLSSESCFEFLLQYAGRDCIVVGFSIGYDINKWLKDVPRETLEILWSNGQCEWEGYYIEWLQGKYFRLCRQREEPTKRDSVTIYDVFGFFQKSFIRALQDWKIEVPKVIVEGKAARSNFTQKQRATIRKYNLIECDLLVQMMNKVRAAMIEADCLPSQWHGAGAIATQLFQQHRVVTHNAQPNAMYEKFLAAYYGGRVQLLKQGEAKQVWCHDINSAYPAAMMMLPSAQGEWSEVTKLTQNRFSLYYVEWDLPKDAILSPFPFRHKRAIHWPLTGAGWYWMPEVSAALAHYGNKRIKVKFGYEFTPNTNAQPFSFLPRLYEKRKEFINQGSDAQLILKLGINACYGKVAQSIGYGRKAPAFQNYFWAGWITSLTRARIFDMCMRSPASVIAISTDGIVSLDKLCEHSPSKLLGGWDVQSANNFFSLQSGVYIFNDEDGKSKIRTRGFSPRSINYEDVRKIWRKSKSLGEYAYNETRFIGLGIALRTDFETWGDWKEQERKLNFWPNGDVDITSFKKQKLVDVMAPRQLESDLSQSYQPKLDWFESQEGKDYLEELEQKK